MTKMEKLKLELIKIILSNSPDTHNPDGLQSLLTNEIKIWKMKNEINK